MIIVLTAAGFAADVNRRTSAALRHAVGDGTGSPFHKAGTEGIVGLTGIFAPYFDISLGTQFVFVVNTCDCLSLIHI